MCPLRKHVDGGNNIVFSAGPFKYFLGKGWTTLIDYDPWLAHAISLHSFLYLSAGFH